MTKLKYPMEVYESYLPAQNLKGHLNQECVDKYVEYRMCYKKKDCDYKHAKEIYEMCRFKHTRRIDNYQTHFAVNYNPIAYRKNPVSNNVW